MQMATAPLSIIWQEWLRYLGYRPKRSCRGLLSRTNTLTTKAIGKPTLRSQLSLEASEIQFEGENKARFLDFIRKMLRWVPEERAATAQLLDDP